MKKTILGLVAALALCAGAAQAQQYKINTINTGTNVIGANATLTPTDAIVTSTKSDNVALSVSFALSGAGTNNIVSSWAKSVDGVRYESTPSVTLTSAGNGTNTVTGLANVPMGGAGFLKLVSVQNANTPSTVTNLVIKAALKPAN